MRLMRALVALVLVAFVASACWSNAGTSSTSPVASPAPHVSSLRFIFRTWDGTAYGIFAANVDGNNRVDYHSPTYKDPQFMRLVSSHYRSGVTCDDGRQSRPAAPGRLR